MNDDAAKRRATSVEEFNRKTGAMFGAAKETVAFEPRASDVIISPFAKCGTTWLQQLFHQLRTGGDTDYDDISRVVPWIETASIHGVDLNAEQRANPRGFKSHLSYDDVPKGAKYIVSLRDPRDALVSMYKFMEGWFIEPGAIDIETFANGTFLNPETRRYWTHLMSWWAQRDNPDVLLLCYEHMLAQPAMAIARVAGFIGVPQSDALLSLALERSSIGYMLEHKDKFDDRMMREISESVCDLPAGSDSAKVREGKSGGFAGVLSDSVLSSLDEIWASDVSGKGGPESYDAVSRELAF